MKNRTFRTHRAARPAVKLGSLAAAFGMLAGHGIADEAAPGWPLPGGERAMVVDAAGLTQPLALPVPDPRQDAMGGAWCAVVSLDLHGLAGKEPATLRAELVEPATGTVLARSAGKAEQAAPRAAWSVLSSSGHPGSAAAQAFDGEPGSQWHSRYGQDQAVPPHWIGLEFGEPRPFTGVSYLPRQGGFTNGVARRYRLEVRPAGAEWRTVLEGESDRAAQADRREALELKLAQPLEVEAFRLVIVSDWSGGGFGTAAEVVPFGIPLPAEEAPAIGQRLWLEIPTEVVAQAKGQALGLKLSVAKGSPVVVGRPRVALFHDAPDGKLLGKANGHLGPDKLGAGLLGFTALLEHGVDALSVMAVRPDGPAAAAGLMPGDVIVAVDGRPLPPNDLAPGWNWFHRSHEALLGRAGEEALAGKRPVRLQVLRDGNPVTLSLALPERPAFTTLDPATDPAAKAMRDDLLDWLRTHQREDGSWSGDIIRTTLSALALLATGDAGDAGDAGDEERVKRAVEWAMKRYPEPATYGNLGFWHGGYAGTLYGEWFLRTGDERVLPHLEALRDWAVAGQHESVWGVPALGHGPPHLPYGNKSLVAPSCHLLLYEALATRCGMESALWELLLPYMELAWSDPAEGGHGGLGYNKSFKDKGEFWFRTGVFAMACHLRGERPDMRDAMIAFMRERHPWIRNSHAYGEPGGAWGLLALNLVSPEAFAEVMREHRWWFSLAWEPGYGLRFTTPHMGAPYMGEEDLINAAYALVLQGPRRSLHLTGREGK